LEKQLKNYNIHWGQEKNKQIQFVLAKKCSNCCSFLVLVSVFSVAAKILFIFFFHFRHSLTVTLNVAGVFPTLINIYAPKATNKYTK